MIGFSEAEDRLDLPREFLMMLYLSNRFLKRQLRKKAYIFDQNTDPTKNGKWGMSTTTAIREKTFYALGTRDPPAN
jgi:hypothetical protein